jgi:hypothetical protein
MILLILACRTTQKRRGHSCGSILSVRRWHFVACVASLAEHVDKNLWKMWPPREIIEENKVDMNRNPKGYGKLRYSA